MRFEYEDLVIDTRRLVVERGGELVPVQPQVFDVLTYLLAHRDRVVTKEELLDEVWGDRFVSESALTSRIKSARQLVGDDGTAQRAIMTSHGRGYRWVAAVTVSETEVTVAPESPAGLEPPPRRLTRLVGREQELDDLLGTLSGRALVTLVGPPGVGKSALASEAAGCDRFDRLDVAFADVGSCRDRPDVVASLRRAVGVHRQSPDDRSAPDDDAAALAAVIGRLCASTVLLVIDNCDAVAGDVAGLAIRLLADCPTLTILATSHRPLGVAGEHVHLVGPLAVPPPQPSWSELMSFAAGRLFAERSRDAGAEWSERDDDARSIAAICRRVDGLPLAIELYAARSRWMSLDDVLRQLDDDLVDAAHDGRRTDPLTVAVRSSRSELTAEERDAFDALSVFVGSFDFDAALAVIAAVRPDVDPLELFESLVESSLVDIVDGRTRRYRLLGPLRVHARSCRLGTELDTIATAAHLEYFLQFVRRRWPVGRIATVHPWSALTDEIHEIEAAARRARSRPADARRLLGALGWFWWTGGIPHKLESLAVEVEQSAESDAVEARAAFAFVRMLGLVLVGRDPVAMARTAHSCGVESESWSVAAWAAAFEVAPDMMWIDLRAVSERWDEIVELFRRGDDLAGEAWATTIILGYAQVCARQHEAAARSYESAAGMLDRCGDQIGVVRVMVETVEQHIWTSRDVGRARFLYDSIEQTPSDLPVETRAKLSWLGGLIAGAEGDHEAEVALHLEAMSLCERHLPDALLTNTLRAMAGCAFRRAGRLAEAAATFARAIPSIDRLHAAPGVSRHRAWLLERSAGLLIDLGHPALAAEVFGAIERLRAELDAPMPYWDEPDYDSDVALLVAQLGRTELDARWAIGAQRPIAEVVADLLTRLRFANVTPRR